MLKNIYPFFKHLIYKFLFTSALHMTSGLDLKAKKILQYIPTRG